MPARDGKGILTSRVRRAGAVAEAHVEGSGDEHHLPIRRNELQLSNGFSQRHILEVRWLEGDHDAVHALPQGKHCTGSEADAEVAIDGGGRASAQEMAEYEAAALAADPRISNSDGGSFDAATGRKVLANSRGFAGSYRSSYAGVAAAPLAQDANGSMQRDGWWSSARRLADLDSPEAIGKEAARRAIRRLGARRVPTQRVPIVFSPEVARSLIGSVFEAASGDAIWRGAFRRSKTTPYLAFA